MMNLYAERLIFLSSFSGSLYCGFHEAVFCTSQYLLHIRIPRIGCGVRASG